MKKQYSRQRGFVGRLMDRFKEVFIGSPDDQWLTGQTPIEPKEPMGEPPRIFQYVPGYNIAIQPRSTEQISFPALRNLSTSCDLLRIIIERAKEALKADDWDIGPADDDTYVSQVKINRIKKFFDKPDKRNMWDEWLGMVLEEVLVVDALSIYVHPTRGGEVYGFDVIDGATIKPLINTKGYQPDPPAPAYQQYLYGVPYAVFTRDELCYRIRTRRTHSLYGFSPVEQIVITINQAIRRVLYNLGQLNEGTVPVGLMEMPENWSLQDIEKFEQIFNAWMAGDPVNRSRIKFVPHGSKLQKFRDDEIFQLWNQFDEWLARIICYVIGLNYQAFVSKINKSIADQAAVSEQEQGLGGIRKFIERLINYLIEHYLHVNDLKFKWVTDHQHDAKLKVMRNVSYVQAGIYLRDEVRAREGMPPIAVAAKKLGVEVPLVNPVPMKEMDGSKNPNDQEHNEEVRERDDVQGHVQEHEVMEEMDKWYRKWSKAIKEKRELPSFKIEKIPAIQASEILAEMDSIKSYPTIEDLKRIFKRKGD